MLALRLAREGACIAAVGLEPENLSAKTRCAAHAPARAWTADVTDHDQMRTVAAADQDEVMARFRARLPWPASATGPLDPAVDRIAAGILRRAPRVYAPPWVRAVQLLPRGAVTAAVTRTGAREVARVAAELRATAAARRRPLGPGGAAALAGTAGHPAPPGLPAPGPQGGGPGPAGSR